MEKLAMNTRVAEMGRKEMVLRVWLSTNSFSFSKKYTPRPTMETLMRTSDVIRRILRPNLSTRTMETTTKTD